MRRGHIPYKLSIKATDKIKNLWLPHFQLEKTMKYNQGKKKFQVIEYDDDPS